MLRYECKGYLPYVTFYIILYFSILSVVPYSLNEKPLQYLTQNETEKITSAINKHIQKGRTSTKVQRPEQLKNSSFRCIINIFYNTRLWPNRLKHVVK
jgi:hypothetical protein